MTVKLIAELISGVNSVFFRREHHVAHGDGDQDDHDDDDLGDYHQHGLPQNLDRVTQVLRIGEQARPGLRP